MVRKAVLLLFISLFLATAQGQRENMGNDSVDSKAEDSGKLEEILALPAFELKHVKGNENEIRIGDTLSFELRPEGIESDRFAAGQLKWELLPGSSPLFEQGWLLVGNPVFANGILRFRVSTLQPGELSLPQLVLVNGSTLVLRTEPFSVKVLPAIDPQDPNAQIPPTPFYPPARVPLPAIGYATAGIALALLIVLLIQAVRWYLQSRKRQPITFIAPEARRKSEDVVALSELQRLEDLKLYAKGDYKGHYFGVSFILKTYLGRRFHFEALESTTDELLSRLQHMGIAPQALEKAVVIFSKLDRVKFTDQVPDLSESQQLVDEARDIIGLTKRPVAVPAIAAITQARGEVHAT